MSWRKKTKIWLIIVVFAGSASALTNNESEEYVYEPYPAVSNDLLRQYDPDYENFEGVQIADKIVYFQQRSIGEAIVQKDYILYHFDKDTRELLDIKMHWRDDLPEQLPKIISKNQAEAMVDGEIRFSQLYYISAESDVFPIKPTPKNPCWVLETLHDSRITVTVIDAVEGKIVGYGVPPPSYTAFSLSGPLEFSPCEGVWREWYENARDWFNTMGYTTEGVEWPTEDKVKSHIQSHETVMFYELAHGGSTYFYNGCSDYTTADEIETWIAYYHKMPFAFMGSCDGMCNTGNGTLSYEFRKGSNENTVTVGYCGMSDPPCVDSCWYAGYTIDWQTILFGYMNQGLAVKAAFDLANALYPGCGANSCMRFAGDETFALVPVVERRGAGIIQSAINAAVDGDTIIVPEGTYYENLIDFKGKNLTVRSTEPNDPNVVAATVINGGNQAPVVIFISGEDANCVIAGFTITGGAAPYGGGIYCENSSPTITNCTFSGNLAAYGGGMGNFGGSSPTLTNCTFSSNSAGEGGGMWNQYSSPTLTNCTFSGNFALRGGGMYNELSSPTLTNCTFSGNNTQYNGGGMCNDSNSSPMVTNCTFSGNRALGKGGGMCNQYLCSPTVTNCTFSGNAGGGMRNNYESSPTITNCTFSGSSGVGMSNKDNSSPTVTNCTFSRYPGSGMSNRKNSNPTVSNCTFSGNEARWEGGGMFNFDSNPTITNCTFSGNSAGTEGGGMYNYDSSPTVTNCIVWGNSPAQIIGVGDVEYSDIEGGWEGEGNIDADPCFVDADSNDFHLQPGSPCIDAGDNNSIPQDITDLDGDGDTNEPIPWDIEGNPRIADGNNDCSPVVDMGAYEYFVPPIEVAMKFTPEALNLGSKGKWVKAHCVLPEEYTVEDVDVNTPATLELLGIEIESDYINVFVNEDDLVEVEIAFERGAFCGVGTSDDWAEAVVTGSLTCGRRFRGRDTIKIVNNKFKCLAVLASYWLEEDCGKPDWCGGADLDQDSAVNFTDFAFFDGCCLEVITE